jgi:predicted P-loop ATPase
VKPSKIEQLEAWLSENYTLRKNLITRQIENGKVLDEYARNSIWRAAKKKFEKILFEDICRIINSDFTPAYNPIRDFFEQEFVPVKGCIEQLAATIETDSPANALLFIRKWLISAVASVYGYPSRLMLILTGKQRTGKTEWLRRLLPPELEPYGGEISDGMKDNDLNIMMTQKMILIDDEFQAKSKREEAAQKALLSKKVFTLREPYGRANIDLVRLATLCATSNDIDIFTDPTGNTRYLPVLVNNIDQSAYNNIDKKFLWMEAYQLFKAGHCYELSEAENVILETVSKDFDKPSLEYEMLMKWVAEPVGNSTQELTATDIKNELETRSVQKLSLDRIGKELKRLGFEREIKKIDKKTKGIYKVIIRQIYTPTTPGTPQEKKDETSEVGDF